MTWLPKLNKPRSLCLDYKCDTSLDRYDLTTEVKQGSACAGTGRMPDELKVSNLSSIGKAFQSLIQQLRDVNKPFLVLDFIKLHISTTEGLHDDML